MNSINLKEFTEKFNNYVNEIGCMGNPDGYIASHKIVGGICVEDDSDDSLYEVIGLDINQLGGCGCWSDIIIKIRRKDEN
jgi:hypothetical protein